MQDARRLYTFEAADTGLLAKQKGSAKQLMHRNSLGSGCSQLLKLKVSVTVCRPALLALRT